MPALEEHPQGLPGNLVMVRMQHLSPKDRWKLLRDVSLTDQLQQALQEALVGLHEPLDEIGVCVHGDVRARNIMVR